MGALLFALALRLLRSLPLLVTGLLVAAWFLVSMEWPHPLPGAVLVLVNALLGATIASLLWGRFRAMALSRRIITLVLLAGALAAEGWVVGVLATEGFVEDLAQVRATSLPREQQLQEPAPSRWR